MTTELVPPEVFCERVAAMLVDPSSCSCACGGSFVVMHGLAGGVEIGSYLLCMRCGDIPIKGVEGLEPSEPGAGQCTGNVFPHDPYAWAFCSVLAPGFQPAHTRPCASLEQRWSTCRVLEVHEANHPRRYEQWRQWHMCAPWREVAPLEFERRFDGSHRRPCGGAPWE